MRAAGARSKSVRLALALAAVLIALAGLSWWMRVAQDRTADVAVGATERPIAASALELDSTSIESAGEPGTSARKAEELLAVVDAAPHGAVEWGRLHLTVRSTDPRVKLTKGTAFLSARALRSREQLATLDPSKYSRFYNGGLDANGRVEFNHLPFGDWALEVKAEGFDLVERRLIIARGPIMTLELAVDPVAITELTVVLRHPDGIPLFDAVEGALLETVKSLRLAIVAECPRIGADLPDSARRLVQRSRFVRPEHPDQWMQATFKRPVAGCACVLLGERVLDAAPFTAAQAVVVLRVEPLALNPPRSAIEVVVTDELSREPLAGARVEVLPVGGGSAVQVTDAQGRARIDGLMAGDLRIVVQAADHVQGERRVTVTADKPLMAESFVLTPQLWVRGSVRFPASGRMTYGVSAVRLTTRDRDPAASAFRANLQEDVFDLGPLGPEEYMVGVGVPNMGLPVAAHVRKGDVDGWCIVDLRRGSVDGVKLVITEAIAAELRRFEKPR